ncbi:hypothetical protein ACFSJU_03875 [Paradesertivirga mongoliensis]|uniref:Lipocalin-like domain-containing protein n=1 Tax=Paradesertivirga mongoliensis TaxID=2100740 RepID=A0ABW4ZHM7_9SPHI|nr:hypothetical protein [Pedobacter mongoliensis]
MRSFLFYFLVITIFALFSCESESRKTAEPEDHNISLLGKWYRFSRENGYTEFDIDSQNVVFYNQKVGRFELPYTVENDSLKYLTNKYAGKITHYGDSIHLEGNDQTTASLYRFKDPNIPFNSIPEETDSLSFRSYQKGFDERLVREFEKAGIEISDGMGRSEDTGYEELLKKKVR